MTTTKTTTNDAYLSQTLKRAPNTECVLMLNAQSYRTYKAYTLCTAHMPIMYCTCIFPPSSSASSFSLFFIHFFFLFALVPHSRTFFFCLSSVVFRSSRCAVSRMSAAAAVTACCAVSKCVGQNHRKSFRLVSHFRLVCTVCLNGSAHSLARSLSHSMCVYVPFELLRLGQALFLFHYISAYLVHTAHIMCIALHCIV